MTGEISDKCGKVRKLDTLLLTTLQNIMGIDIGRQWYNND